MRLGLLALVPVLAASVAVLHCGGTTVGANQNVTPDGGPAPTIDAGPDPALDGGPPNPDAVGATTSSKVDILLVVDNSASMGDKAKLLATSLPSLLQNGAAGNDVHLGVITASLGAMGGDVCGEDRNSRAHLSTVGPGNAPLASASQGFIRYGGGGSTDIGSFIADAQTLVNGVGETGCGLEAQLESMYRFLVQPDPWQDVKIDQNNQAKLDGVDVTLLQQRKAFLRPDSLVVIVMLTDEDDSSADPRSIGGQGWAFMANQFPGSPNFRADGKTTTAPRATSTCSTDPGSPDCTSCGFAATCNPSDAACQKIKNDPECQKTNGYYGPTEEQLNVRFHRMKQRFGIDPQFPISRYADGLTKTKVPNRDSEHIQLGTKIGDYAGTPTCTNPLFAASLPAAAGDELCNLPVGPRGKELVVFAVIGGVPNELAGPSPDWTKILGQDPEHYDLSGLDPHMIQSTTPRAGLAPPSSTRGDNGTDPVNGREWDTSNNDLQYACTFDLPTPRTCSLAEVSCDCADASRNPPLCSAALGTQIKAKAYPTPRELLVAKKLGDRGVAGSLCPSGGAGYTGTLSNLASRIGPRVTK